MSDSSLQDTLRSLKYDSRVVKLGTVIGVIGLIGTLLSMIGHLVGFLLGWWPADFITYWVALGFVFVMYVSRFFPDEIEQLQQEASESQ